MIKILESQFGNVALAEIQLVLGFLRSNNKEIDHERQNINACCIFSQIQQQVNTN